jgi:hypothetical protein
METNAQNYFNYALMIIVAKRIATMAQTNRQAADDYFDMHAQQLSPVEREIFSNAVIDAAISLQTVKIA